jgi:hypothetical protein
MEGKPIRKQIFLDLNSMEGSMISSTDGSRPIHIPIRSSRDRWICLLDSCDSWYEAFLGLHCAKEDHRRGSRDHVGNIECKGSIFWIRKKRDGQEIILHARRQDWRSLTHARRQGWRSAIHACPGVSPGRTRKVIMC